MTEPVEIFHDLFLESGYINFQDFFVQCIRRMSLGQSRSLCKVAREIRDEAIKEQKEMQKRND